jgi:hypothetical protein
MSTAMSDGRACPIAARHAPAPRGLVVEDQVLIGLAIEAYPSDIGFEVGASFRSEADALRWLARERPDFAIVDDAPLSDGPCVALAAALRRNGIPFVVYSGYRQDMAGPRGRADPETGRVQAFFLTSRTFSLAAASGRRISRRAAARGMIAVTAAAHSIETFRRVASVVLSRLNRPASVPG